MRVHANSDGVDLTLIQPGADLCLSLVEGHGLDAPEGVVAGDYLDIDDRCSIDGEAVAALAAWRAATDELLTVDGTCLAFVGEWPLMRPLLRTLREGAGLWEAIRRHQPDRLVLHGGDARVLALVGTIADAAGLGWCQAPGTVATRLVERAPSTPLRTLRRGVLRRLLQAGTPSRLRHGCVLTLSYWPLVPVLDELLDDPDVLVAVPLQKLPAGPRRSLRAFASGGWLGHPGRGEIEKWRASVSTAVGGVRSMAPPSLPGERPWDLGRAVHDVLLDVIAEDGPEQVAVAAHVRAALRRSRPRLVLATYDTEPFPRTVVAVARSLGVRTFVLAHGAYLMPQTLKDMELADEAAIYSNAVGFPGMRRDRPVHVVGYPVPVDGGVANIARKQERVVVIGANGHPFTALLDERLAARHFAAALEALRQVAPDRDIILRPHPSQDLAPLRSLVERHAGRVSIDASTPLLPLLASAGLCIGGLSTATLQAGVVDTPTVVLNISGFEWPWPLGGTTSVPVATSVSELATCLAAVGQDDHGSGGDDLRAALGADRTDAVEELHKRIVAAAS